MTSLSTDGRQKPGSADCAGGARNAAVDQQRRRRAAALAEGDVGELLRHATSGWDLAWALLALPLAWKLAR